MLAANHVPLVAHVILLEHVIFFPCLFEYRHQPSLPCTAWNITFISIICIFTVVRASFFTTWAGIRYANVGGVTISDPDCYITVGVMFWFACFSVFFIHEIYIRRRKLWCLRLISMHRTLIQLCQGKDSFPFYGTYNKKSLGGRVEIKETAWTVWWRMGQKMKKRRERNWWSSFRTCEEIKRSRGSVRKIHVFIRTKKGLNSDQKKCLFRLLLKHRTTN